MMNFDILNLQLFAEAGSVVNTTTGSVNAHTGVAETTNAMDPQLKTYYDTQLLENARISMIYSQFAKKQPLPANNGLTVEWRKWNTFAKATELKEGVIPDGQKFGSTKLTGTIKQYGTFAAVSDKLEMHSYDDTILGCTEEMGASAAETQETLIRDALLGNNNVLYCDNITLATGAKSGATPTNCGGMEASDTVMSVLTPDMVARAVTIMKKNKAPTIGGKYVAVIHPSVAYDLRKSKEWVEAHKYASPEEIYNGEIGQLHGCRFIENVFAPVLGGETYQNKASGVTYATYMFGKDAFGTIDPEGGAMEMIVKDKSQIGGPLNQFSTIGYKLESDGATVLYPERMLRIMSCSTFSATDEVN